MAAGPSEWSRHWDLDPDVAFLNHGSFGACPRAVLAQQDRLRAQLEREPVRFFREEAPELLDAARGELGAFVGADPDDLAFVPNATAGANTVLRSLSFAPGDELLVSDHEYPATRNALEFAAGRAGARPVVVPVPFPLDDPGEVVERFLAHVTRRTRLALVDHVTSPTGLVLPLAELVRELERRSIDVLVDGAHAPGMLPLDLDGLGAAYYTGNGHKWLGTPKGSAFLHVRRDRQAAIRPLAISHGATWPTTERSRFRIEFDWTGTADPTPFLCVPAALRFFSELLPGGWSELRARNRELALSARSLLTRALELPAPSPDAMIGSLAAVPLPDDPAPPAPGDRGLPRLQRRLRAEHAIQVPVVSWPGAPRRLLRVSAQLYNTEEQYEALAGALADLLAEEQDGEGA